LALAADFGIGIELRIDLEGRRLATRGRRTRRTDGDRFSASGL